jgi:hypothetical protein
MQFFADDAVAAGDGAGGDVGVDRFLPVADAGEGVGRHVPRVRRVRCNLRVAPRRLERAVGQRRIVVAVNDVVRQAGVIRVGGDQRFENRASLQRFGVAGVGRRRGGDRRDGQGVKDRRLRVGAIRGGHPADGVAIGDEPRQLIDRPGAVVQQ